MPHSASSAATAAPQSLLCDSHSSFCDRVLRRESSNAFRNDRSVAKVRICATTEKPARRAIFETLAAGGMNASALREGMEISQPAMSQHLSVLRGANLVREERQGRFVNYEVDPVGWLS
jgi:DNA-binding transcriptional ArsR family regulator